MIRVLLAAALLCIASPSLGATGDTALASHLAPGLARGYPGLAVIFRNAAGVTRSAAVGYRDAEHHIALKTTDPFHICSITKVFTAVAALRLVDQGRLSLDATLLQVLGEPAAAIPTADRITVAQLLDHSSGIYPTNNDMTYLNTMLGAGADPHRVWAPEDMVALAYRGRNEPVAEPGVGHHYSDTNYILLGMIVAKVTGRPLGETIRTNLLEPLGMTSTYFYSEVAGGRLRPKTPTVQGYLLNSEDIRHVIAVNPMFKAVTDRTTPAGEVLNTTLASERVEGAANIVSTLPDMMRFATAVFHGKLLSPRSQAFLMAAGGPGLAVDEQRTWALQSMHRPFGMLVCKQGDGPGGETAIMAYRPEIDEIYVAFTNSFGHFDESDFLIDGVIGSLTSASARAAPGR